MEKKIITISRQFGSAGRSIGKKVAQQLGIPYYDKELIKQVAEKTGFAPEYIENIGEYAPSKSIFSYALPFLGGGNTMMFGDLIESKFLTEGNWNVGSALSLIMMLLILISLGILRKFDPEGEGGGIA